MNHKTLICNNPEDVRQLVYDHCETLGISYDKTKTDATINYLVCRNDNTTKGIILLSGEDNVPIGYLAAIVLSNLITNETIANELGYYCKVPGQGHKLIKAYETWAKENGATSLTLSSHGTDRLDKYYERYGYTLKERIFTKELI